ncbi:MAG: glutamate synthase (NADPH), homotetrameric [Nitrospirae bacterium RIFCSPHIGHO2_02_FULL_42_12]|nr:MAG: glutamate synthase (NADPH), homotetrameric [Nitrospirae bacterium RIFCSPHIGHO2_02_FULL_42_12]
MQIPIQDMPEQEPAVRVRNFTEVPTGYPEVYALTESKRCLDGCKAPCIKGCPVGIDIPAFIKKIEERDFIGAARSLKKYNLLPAICGRVCPQQDQCELVCVVAKKGASVAIGRLERFAADYERMSGLIEIPEMAPPTGRKIAIVGSGPAGLTGASELARLGHKVTIFEALHRPGGVLVYGIPRFRLPIDVIDTEIEMLKKMGVEIICNAVIGKTLTVDDLFAEGYEAVLIGTGAGLPYFMNIPGENLCGIYSANEFLTRVNLMRADLFPESLTPVFLGKRVAIIGAGDTAMDAARTSARLKPEKVTVYYRRSRDEAPCLPREMEHAEQEGVGFKFLTNPVRFIGDDNYFVKGMQCIKMELGEPDASGRRSPKPIPGSEFIEEIDTVVMALGFGVNPIIKETTPGLDTNKKGIIIVDPATGKTSREGVYAAGDIITGGATVIKAMGQAKVASKAIHEYILSKSTRVTA